MVATRLNSTLGTNFTQATLVTALKAAMLDAGFSAPVDEYTFGTDKVIVYSFIVDSSQTFGTTYYRIRVSSAFIIFHSLYATWNTTSHTGLNPSPEYSFNALVTTNTINFTALNGGGEYKFLFITQNSAIVPLGVIAPANKPNWWNLNNWNYGFIWTSVNLNILASTAINPYNASTYNLIINNSTMVSANPQTGATDVLTGLILLTASNKGIAGKTSEDLGSACIFSTSRYNTIPSDTVNQNFLIINPVAGGLVIKTL
jgi:hypothetical protein